MGVKKEISLQEARELFEEVSFEKIVPTKNGISDTTYFAYEKEQCYVIKHYEDALDEEMEKEAALLELLHEKGLKVGTLLSISRLDHRWRLYSCIKGKSIERPNFRQIAQIATFLAKFHSFTNVKMVKNEIFDRKRIETALKSLRSKNLGLYHRFKEIRNYYRDEIDGTIHGDLFTDNAKFKKNRLSGVFDFIESSKGSFILDAGVTALSFASTSRAKTVHFLNSYNSASRKKLTLAELVDAMRFAALFYALQRYNGSQLDYKELLKKFRMLA